jgi:methionyl-tRNA formyltransferase
MAGDVRTGVTIHRTIAELDAGPIAAQRAFDVGPDDDAGAIYVRSAEIAAELLGEVLAQPEPAFTPQPGDGVTYAEKIRPEDRELDLTRPVPELVNRVRALAPHIGARAVVDGRPLIVWKARAAADGSLELVEVQPEGGRRMSFDEYVRGRRA